MSHLNRVTLQITGAENDNGNVRFDHFIQQLQAFKEALVQTDLALSDHRSVYYRVVDLHHSSPAAIVLEAVGNNADAVLSTFYRGFKSIQQDTKAPPEFTYDTLMAFRGMVNLVGKGVSSLELTYDEQSVPLSHVLVENVEKILGPDEYEIGDYSGMLHQINLHGGQKALTIYPSWGGPKLHCVFPEDLRQKAVQAVDHHVTVSGRLKYKQSHDHPYEMEARDIEIHPDDAELPNLFDLRGIAPGATGDLTSEEFIREVRSQWP